MEQAEITPFQILKILVSMDYIDGVLIKLRRAYSKDETVAALNRKLSEAEIENGKLKSEIDELKYDISESRKELNQLKQTLNLSNDENKAIRKEIKEQEMYQSLRAAISQHKAKIKSQKQLIDNLFSRINNPAKS